MLSALQTVHSARECRVQHCTVFELFRIEQGHVALERRQKILDQSTADLGVDARRLVGHELIEDLSNDELDGRHARLQISRPTLILPSSILLRA